jgi:SAM-dependent methyltransferase
LKEFFYQFLRIDVIRAVIAALRYFFFAVVCRRFRVLHLQAGDVKENAVSHNRRHMKGVRGFAVIRSSALLHALSAIQISKSLPVLAIGPRTEGELLNLKGLGFRNVRGIDLMSYSPWIDLGDMHALPYKDSSFAVVIMGWVLTYSSNRRKAALEAVRVVRNGGIIAVGTATADPEKIPAGNTQWCPTWKEQLDCFEPYIDHLYFAHDFPPFPVNQRNLLAIFSVKKGV